MKKDIHPKYHKDAVITCACGNEIETSSTVKEAEVEICSECHPFFTGVEKVVDTAGRVEKFKARQKKAEEKSKQQNKTDKKSEEEQKEKEEESGSDFEDIQKQMQENEG